MSVMAPVLSTAHLFSKFVEVRRDIHRHPELAFEEHRTSSLVASSLRAFGLQVTEGIGGTGVVGTLRSGSSDMAIGLRADMDALPINEAVGVAHRSEVNGAMHACGHDGHTTMLLAAAAHMSAKPEFNGTVHFIFQPAEEIGVNSGAQRMMEDGLFDRFPCDMVFAMHNHPGLATGEFMTRSGPFMSASDKVLIVVKGRGGHAARPHLTVDASLVAAAIVMSLQTIVARNVEPGAAAVISVGRMSAGNTYNAIPGGAELELSVRSFDPKVRLLLKRRIEEVVMAQAVAYGAEVRIDYVLGYPVLINDARACLLAVEVAQELIGAAAVNPVAEPIMGSEDFSYMLEAVPGCLMRIGNGIDSSALHNASYDFNDKNIVTGSAFWSALIQRCLPISP